MNRSSSDALNSSAPGYSFGSFRLEPDGTLLRGKAVVHLPPRELEALRLLLAHAGKVVTPLQLKQQLWGDVHVTVDSIPKCLSSLRARLEPDQCIQTVYKRGYRFSADVLRQGAEPIEMLARLAVLPFQTGYNVPDHLGATIAEETIARITSLEDPPVAVLARDSVFTLARKGLTAQKIGDQLNADLVLTGTLRALPGYFRLRAEMIRVADGTQIWVEDLLVDQSRIAGLESELIRLLTHRLSSGKLSVPAAAPLFVERRKRPERKQAYEIFQQARSEWQSLTRHRMQEGLQRLTKATELDPMLIPAQVDFIHACVTQTFYGFMPPAVAAEHVHRIIKAIPDLPERAESIIPALGWINFHADYNLPAAIEAFSLSAHLPHDPWTTRARAFFALSRHRFEEALTVLRAAMHEDPFAPWLHGRLAWTLHLAGQAEESVEQIHKAIALFPDHDGIQIYGGMILPFYGEHTIGLEMARSLAQQRPYLDLATGIHAYALAAAGRIEEAHSLLERLQWMTRERYVLRSFTPAAMIAVGDLDGAMSELVAAADQRCPWFFQMLADPRLQPLHSRPEFAQLQSILANMEASIASEFI